MMTKPLLTLFLTAFALFSSISFAQQNIAVVNLEKAAVNSDYAKSAIKALNDSESYKTNLEEYKKLGGEFQEMQKKGETNALTWSDEQKKSFRLEMEEKLATIKKIGAQLESEKAAAEKQLYQDLAPKINKIVPEIIKDKGIGLLLDARAVQFATADFDITQELVERLNKSQ